MINSWLRLLPIRARKSQLSLKFKLTALTLGLFVAFIWGLVLVSATVLEQHLEKLLADQQLATTAQFTRELDQRLKDNIDGLNRAAAGLPRELSHASLTVLLANRPLMHVAFAAGLMVVGLDGKVIATYPSHGRPHTDYSDRDWFRQVLATGKPYIGRPVVGRTLRRPLLSLAVPVSDAGGQLRAVLVGGIDLTAPNFLGFVSDPSQVGRNEIFVFSTRDNLIVAATDTTRSMTPLPERRANTIYDRLADGFEGSTVSSSSLGIRKLYSARRVPTADWVVLAALPTDIAFGPVRAMQKYLYTFAGLLTLMAAAAIGFMVRRLLAPLEQATRAIGQMTEQNQELMPLAVQRNDEIGKLIRNFNHLVVDRLEFEAALSESEQRFRLLVEGAPEAIFVQTHGRFAYVNAATQQLFGASSAEQLLGQPILDRVHPDYRAVIGERIRQVNQERRNNPALEQAYLRLDGTSVTVEVSAVPFRYGDDDGAIVFARDITDKKLVARELERYRDHLEEQVAERTVQLAEAKQAAEAATRAKSEFLATMSHEIRTPLGIIVGLGNVLRQKLRDPALEKRLRQLCDSADHLSTIVNDILDLSKIDAGHFELEKSDFRLGVLLDKVTNLIGELARERGLTLAVEAPAELRDMLVCGDAIRLVQVLINLTGNAVKFTEQGSVHLGVTVLEETSTDLHLRFAIKDTGVGIAPADRERLFLAFEQADNSTTRAKEGTGLGLAISQKIVALMGGTIRLESQPGVGSTFSFELVLPRGDDAAIVPHAATVIPYFAGARVLVVDDHPVNQEIILDLLETLGCEAEFAGDGVEALECARSAAYNLILMDVRMPRMDGFAATNAIRALAQHRNTPILAVTANAFSEDRQRCLDAGMNGYIGKPFTLATLAAGLKPWLPSQAGIYSPQASNDELARALNAIPGLDASCLFRVSAKQPSDYVALLRRYVDMQEHDMERLNVHLASNEHDAARDVVHQLKGASGLIGARRIVEFATEIEVALRGDADTDALMSLTTACAAEFERLATAVRALAEKHLMT